MFKEVAQGVDPKVATILFGFLRFLLSFAAAGMLHNYGRRPLCIYSAIIMGIALLICGICYHLRAIGN